MNGIPHTAHKGRLREEEGEMEEYCINSKSNLYFHAYFFEMLSKTKLMVPHQDKCNCVFKSSMQKLSESHHMVY